MRFAAVPFTAVVLALSMGNAMAAPLDPSGSAASGVAPSGFPAGAFPSGAAPSGAPPSGFAGNFTGGAGNFTHGGHHQGNFTGGAGAGNFTSHKFAHADKRQAAADVGLLPSAADNSTGAAGNSTHGGHHHGNHTEGAGAGNVTSHKLAGEHHGGHGNFTFASGAAPSGLPTGLVSGSAPAFTASATASV